MLFPLQVVFSNACNYDPTQPVHTFHVIFVRSHPQVSFGNPGQGKPTNNLFLVSPPHLRHCRGGAAGQGCPPLILELLGPSEDVLAWTNNCNTATATGYVRYVANEKQWNQQHLSYVELQTWICWRLDFIIFLHLINHLGISFLECLWLFRLSHCHGSRQRSHGAASKWWTVQSSSFGWKSCLQPDFCRCQWIQNGFVWK